MHNGDHAFLLSVDNQLAQIGRRIRDTRKSKGFTLVQLAEQAGLSSSYLSQIENGRVNINFINLESISKALNTPIINFFVEPRANDISILRSSDRRWFPLGGSAEETLLVKSKSNLEIFVIHLPPGTDTVKESSHPGEEFCYVLNGTISMVMRGSEEYSLQEGDVIYYPSTISHLWRNRGNHDAAVIVVNTPATF